jgi:hypothetical protein
LNSSYSTYYLYPTTFATSSICGSFHAGGIAGNLAVMAGLLSAQRAYAVIASLPLLAIILYQMAYTKWYASAAFVT